MPLNIYQPTPVLVPDSVPVRRGFRNRKAFQAAQPVQPGGLENYDSQTVLFDIWVEEDYNQLLAIGPPSINFDKELYPVTVKCNGEPVSISKVEYRRGCTWCGSLPASIRDCALIEIELQFRKFECVVKLQPRPAPDKAVPLAQVTLQKDNPPKWVCDWCLWHHRICGVQRIYLYDNGSDHFEALVDAVESISSDIDITIVRWPYIFGADYKDCSFAQTAALNHHRMMFGRNSTWVLSCDIDEYVVVDDSQQLAEILRTHEKDGFAVVLLGYYYVPPSSSQLPKMKRSIRDYTYQDRNFELHDRHIKYIYRPSTTRWNTIHIADPKHPFLDGLRFAPLLYDRLFRKVIRFLIKYKIFRITGLPLKVTVEADGRAYFLHFLGLNTNWKTSSSENVVQYSEIEHVDARKLAELIQHARL